MTLKVVVDRKRWLRGEGETRSFLLRSADGKMCCLGFACLAAGHTEDEIRDVATPNGLNAQRDGGCNLPNWLSMPIGKAMSINDDTQRERPDYTDEQRETDLIQALGPIGIELSFEG